MMEKMMDPNIIGYYIINCAIPSMITIVNRYQIDFGKPVRFNWTMLSFQLVTSPVCRKRPRKYAHTCTSAESVPN